MSSSPIEDAVMDDLYLSFRSDLGGWRFPFAVSGFGTLGDREVVFGFVPFFWRSTVSGSLLLYLGRGLRFMCFLCWDEVWCSTFFGIFF